VPVAGTGGRAKIKAALTKGPEQLVETIRADLGIPVSHYLDPGYDLGRIRRQQVLLRALAAQALRRGLTNPLRANAVVPAAANHLTRDDTLTLGEAVRLAVQFHAFRPETLVGLTIPTVPALRRGDVVLRPGQPGFPQAWAQGGWEQILLPVQPATRQTVARFLGRPGPAHPSPATPTRPAPREPC
jgi:hypothetical protein